MNIGEYKKGKMLHVELPSGLVFDCKPPSGLLVSRFQQRLVGLDIEHNALAGYEIMLSEFEHCFPEGLKIEDIAVEDYAALMGIASPFFFKNPFQFPSGSVTNSEKGTPGQEPGPTTT